MPSTVKSSDRTRRDRPGSRSAKSASSTSGSQVQRSAGPKAAAKGGRTPRIDAQVRALGEQLIQSFSPQAYLADPAHRQDASTKAASAKLRSRRRQHPSQDSFVHVPQGIARDRDGQSILVEIGVGKVWLNVTAEGRTIRFPLAHRDVDRIATMMTAAKAFTGELI